MTAIQEAIEAAGGPSKVAKALNRSAQAIAFYRDGKRDFPPELAARLEAASGFKVRRWHLFPDDWHRIWPELVAAPGAPAAPAAPSTPLHLVQDTQHATS